MSKQFSAFPKMARFSREIVITEKIDGTNASIFIQPESLEEDLEDQDIIARKDGYTMRAGSRTRWIRPGKNTDNYGFAQWVKENSEELFKLGEGHHFGEWWGRGINSGYGLDHKRFSLFNTYRWNDETKPSCCYVVPILYQGNFNTLTIESEIEELNKNGSVAAPGFMDAEGIVIFHTAGNVGFKKTIKNDESPKSLVK